MKRQKMREYWPIFDWHCELCRKSGYFACHPMDSSLEQEARAQEAHAIADEDCVLDYGHQRLRYQIREAHVFDLA